ncbi:MAG: cardiolipin synthase [Candidatus Muproteobacteria bacterium RBG_19FT_COMBO_61_10]|uniref:Cardiolipin synthase n=1 Tax=Candidatus Muproteobacteria bacterium RBG_19FT_COMBO_61_10 TaxID=1817761 RepID=A0A1F6UNZ2_9PROT|nr:MAG: cardiolipin synthase [Candidatus Muproteobacteria bacterium RBG_19FT_COMBO_61_10]
MCPPALLCLWLLWPLSASAAADAPMAYIDAQIEAHAQQSGVYVLDKGEDVLLARAWLADHARHSIEVQYFIWSTDNIGILASEALLRAADRGVKVRVIVDDLLIDAPDKSLLALARHPNIQIRIYNPKITVGTTLPERTLNVLRNFRGVNQRMHDKTFIVDGKVAITGGRNMADEYYDYDHQYNFRDRDALLLGAVVKAMGGSFENFWASELSVNVEDLYGGHGLLRRHVGVKTQEIQDIYRGLHDYAASPDNFAPEVRAAIAAMPDVFPALTRQLVWGKVDFINDLPGKNDRRRSLGGGGLSTQALAQLIQDAQDHIVIQSPYLVLSDEAMDLFRKTLARGVRVRINTNSLASTDNLQAFSGYRNQRRKLLDLGLAIYEYKPNPEVQRQLLLRHAAARGPAPVFALHAKTMVVDARRVYIGTFNLDPRSENLNTEVGVIIHDPALASTVEAAIETDMLPANSWNAASDRPDQYAGFAKRNKVRFWQLLPIKPLL